MPGAMPPWLAPVQVSVANISEGQADYAESVAQTLKKQGFRAEADLRNEKITYKIRELSLQKVPYILVVGEKEKQAGTVAVRARGGVDLGVMPLSAFAERLSTDVRETPQRGGRGLVFNLRRRQPSLKIVATASTVKSPRRRYVSSASKAKRSVS